MPRPKHRHTAYYGGGRGVFTPASVSGLTVWYKADALALSDAAAVATWTDSSGSGNDATQATGASQPLYKANIVNSKPVVRFDGTDDFLFKSSFTQGTTGTVFAVAIRTGATDNGRAWSLNSGQQAGPFDDGGTWAYYANAAAGVETLTDADTSWGIVTLVYNSVSSAVAYINGTSRATFDPSDQFSDGTFWIVGAANHSGASPWKGDIAEILVYSGALSAANRQAVQSYLGTKYGIAVA